MKTAALILAIAASAGSLILSFVIYRMYDGLGAVARHLLKVDDDVTNVNYSIAMMELDKLDKALAKESTSKKPKKATATTAAKKTAPKKAAAKKTAGRPRKGA